MDDTHQYRVDSQAVSMTVVDEATLSKFGSPAAFFTQKEASESTGSKNSIDTLMVGKSYAIESKLFSWKLPAVSGEQRNAFVNLLSFHLYRLG